VDDRFGTRRATPASHPLFGPLLAANAFKRLNGVLRLV
jgi:hypothetical protein